MKATLAQYQEAVRLYEATGPSAIYDFANQEGITSWSFCPPCEETTPDCEDNACLVCGSLKTPHPGKFKIQMGGAWVWGDLKESVEDGTSYQTLLFDDLETARRTVEELQHDGDDSDFRIVPETHPADIDFYD